MARKSRLSKKTQLKSRQTFLLSVLGIAAILFLLFRYGLPLISDASFLFGRVTSSPDNDSGKTDDESFVPAPDLDSIPKATNEKGLRITGTSLSGLTVVVYLNGSMEEEVQADDSGDFEAELTLTDGENIIKAKAIKDEKESEFSSSSVIVYKQKGSDITIESPSDGQQLKGQNPIEVKGKSDADSNVLVNDFQAITNSDGSWSYFLTLKGGDNEIKVVSTDTAGNKSEKIIHVNYSQ